MSMANDIPDPRYTPRVSFWQRRAVQSVLPWITSLSFHLIILAVALIFLPPLVIRAAREVSKEQVIVPDTSLAEDGHAGGIPNPGLGGDPTRQAAQESDPSAADSKSWALRRSQDLADTLKNNPMENPNAMGAGTSLSSLSAIASGADLAAFGPRGGGGGIAPKSRIFGHGGNVSRVIYVCDGSGSLVGIKEYVLKSELKNAVANLSPIQAFNVLIFQENPGSHFLGIDQNIVMATPNNKSRLFDFLDQNLTFQGTTNPIPALEEAFAENPQLIYLLTDGDFDDPPSQVVLAKINELNADKKVHINTILLLGSKAEKDTYSAFEEIMTTIASENGGVYKKFYCDDF
jgi:von Willebrand factor type A domain